MPTSPERCSFGKHQRLLTPSQFKAVFDGARFKASHRYLLLLARPNQLPHARLGTVVSKKNTRLAVQRNRLKRQLREQFRFHQGELAGLDIVVLPKPGLWQQPNAEIASLVNQQWQRLLKQYRNALDIQLQEAPPATNDEPGSIAG